MTHLSYVRLAKINLLLVTSQSEEEVAKQKKNLLNLSLLIAITHLTTQIC